MKSRNEICTVPHIHLGYVCTFLYIINIYRSLWSVYWRQRSHVSTTIILSNWKDKCWNCDKCKQIRNSTIRVHVQYLVDSPVSQLHGSIWFEDWRLCTTLKRWLVATSTFVTTKLPNQTRRSSPCNLVPRFWLFSFRW